MGAGSHCLMKYKFYQHKILEKKSFSPHIIPMTKGLEESLVLGGKIYYYNLPFGTFRASSNLKNKTEKILTQDWDSNLRISQPKAYASMFKLSGHQRCFIHKKCEDRLHNYVSGLVF